MASQYRAAVGDFVTNVEIEGAAKAASKGTRFSKAKDLTKRLRGWTPWVGDTAVFDARLLSALAATVSFDGRTHPATTRSLSAHECIDCSCGAHDLVSRVNTVSSALNG